MGLSKGDKDGLKETLGCPVGATLGSRETEVDNDGACVLNDGTALGWSEGLSLGCVDGTPLDGDATVINTDEILGYHDR